MFTSCWFDERVYFFLIQINGDEKTLIDTLRERPVELLRTFRFDISWKSRCEWHRIMLGFGEQLDVSLYSFLRGVRVTARIVFINVALDLIFASQPPIALHTGGESIEAVLIGVSKSIVDVDTRTPLEREPGFESIPTQAVPIRVLSLVLAADLGGLPSSFFLITGIVFLRARVLIGGYSIALGFGGCHRKRDYKLDTQPPPAPPRPSIWPHIPDGPAYVGGFPLGSSRTRPRVAVSPAAPQCR